MPEVRERAILVGVDLRTRRVPHAPDGDYGVEESLDELEELAAGAGAVVGDRVLQTRQAAEAATLIGRGKVEELASMAPAADVVIFDHELTPTQQRNLEKRLGTKVIDRTQLILDIFARRARTREGRMQVELAQLQYLLPRLAGRGTEMSRLGGGIGTRGPGETQLETDRRRIARRIKKIQEDLEGVRTGRKVHRRQRHSVPLPTVALVGYTNAGKSTLFNRLTAAGVLADARMFATLDPTVRSLTLPSRRRILASDTVGFIRNLPTTLVKAFRATLEEVSEATLILHLVDASSPHAGGHTAHVLHVLSEIGAAEIPQILVRNKIDRLPQQELDEAVRRSDGVCISALTGEGVGQLLARIDETLPFDPIVRATFRIPLDQPAKISLIHELGRVSRAEYGEDYCEIDADVPESVKAKISA